MADTKISELTATTTVDAAGLIPVVNDPAGTPVNRKITYTNLAAQIIGDIASADVLAALGSQTANRVLAGPTTGSAAAPTFRALVAADIPSLSATYATVASLAAIATSGSASDLSAGTVPDARFPATLPASSGVNLTALNASNLGSGTVPLARLSGITTAELSGTAGITNAQLAGSIAYSKLTLTGAIVNADISASAAIAYSKLNLTGAITNSDLAGSIDLTTKVTGVLPAANGGTGISALGTGVATALGVNVGSAGAFVTFNGALGTPSSGTATNLTGLPVATGISGLGTGVATALAVNVGSAGAPVLFDGAGGTPSSITLTNGTGLPPVTGISGWPANSAGVLTNNGSGTLTWGAGGGGGLTVGTSAITSGTASRVLYEDGSNLLAQAAGFTFDGTSVLTLGVAGASVGGVAFKNATSGTITVTAPTGALGTVALTLPTTSSALAGLAVAQTFSANQTFTGAVDMGGATSLKVPVAGGAAPTTEGHVAVDSTTHVAKIGINGATVALTEYDIASFTPDKPGVSSVVLRFVAARALNFPSQSDGTNAYVKAGVAATAQADFIVAKNGSTFATLRFAAAGTQATWQSASSTDFAAGDVLTITAPSSQDATLANIGFSVTAKMK